MEEKHQELQDQDLLGSPHLEESWIGGNVGLDLLSQIPQRYARIMGEIEREASFARSTMVGKREKIVLGKASHFGEERGPYIGPHEKEPLQPENIGLSDSSWDRIIDDVDRTFVGRP